MDEKISKLFLPLLDKLYNTEPAGEPFRKPVDVVKYGCFDYYYYVKHPIDLSTIRERLVNHQYKDAWRFVADIQLMLDNAYLFNKKGTPVYEYTNKLSKIWNADLTPIMQRLNYCCGTLHKFGPQLLFCHGTTPDRYCQIPIGAKYKCYQDQYSFCLPCFNKIDTDCISIQGLSCETKRMKLPTQPVKKSDFIDCANDNWQYESFIQCSQCSRRVHQICDLYPASDDEISSCIQHAELEHEQKMLCQVPEEYRTEVESEEISKQESKGCQNFTIEISSQEKSRLKDRNGRFEPSETSVHNNHLQVVANSLDDELLQFARDVEDSHCNSAPTSPNPEENRSRYDSAKDDSQHRKLINNNSNSEDCPPPNIRSSVCTAPSHAKNSVDSIAARLSINKLSAETQSDEVPRQTERVAKSHNKFVCNHCYRKKKIGFNQRHKKYSARRLPHTRMSKYIETKVNEYIRENSPTAGEVTIRVLTAYRDTVEVKPEMKAYIQRSRAKESAHHPNLKDYPDEYAYTNRAIFAWQEIDGVDVCVFGMHVQEYGEDCPEPNRQVVYLSYLDSVHFFRPKQVRTAVYHEILLSYFKYVKKLGFRRVFIWVCPSRKGDDYIFYRHPAEQKMPTLKRLSDWYVNLLDKGIMAGIVERHQNIYQYAASQNWNSILSMPYLSGDYWPGEFERLLNIMIESQKSYELRLQQDRREVELTKQQDISDLGSKIYNGNFGNTDRSYERNALALSSMFQKHPPNSSNGKIFNPKTSLISSLGLKPADILPNSCLTPEGDFDSLPMNDEAFYNALTPDSSKSDYDKPLDLSKSSSNTSPESYFDDDRMSELSFKTANNRKRRRKSSSIGYAKRRGRASSQAQQALYNRHNQTSNEASNIRYCSQPTKSSTNHKSSTQWAKDSVSSDYFLDPEEELMKNLDRSLKRQREGFIVARLNDCDCSPHFESQRWKEEATFTCELMKGREPFLQLARLKNYEFSTLRRAKFSSLAMVKHLGQSFKLEPISSFDDSTKLNLPDPSPPSPPPPSHPANNIRSNLHIELDQVLVENFIRHAEVSYDVDFEQMNSESKKLLTHYWSCPIKEICHKCKFVVLSCSFMSVLMRSSRLQMMINCYPCEMLPATNRP